jgi:hypothetical protein
MSDAELRMLLDRAEISDVVHRYATGLDTRDWALYRSIFLDEIEMDFESVGLSSGVFAADKWVEDARTLFSVLDATQHVSSNHVHDIRGDEATCVSYMKAEHFVSDADSRPASDGATDPDRWTIGGYYTNELLRTPDGWKLRKVVLTVTWSRGDRRIITAALKRRRSK